MILEHLKFHPWNDDKHINHFRLERFILDIWLENMFYEALP